MVDTYFNKKNSAHFITNSCIVEVDRFDMPTVTCNEFSFIFQPMPSKKCIFVGSFCVVLCFGCIMLFDFNNARTSYEPCKRQSICIWGSFFLYWCIYALVGVIRYESCAAHICESQQTTWIIVFFSALFSCNVCIYRNASRLG